LAAATATILAAEIAHRNNPAAVALEEAEGIPVGGTVLNIVEARHIATVRPQTGLAALREETPLPTAKLVPDNSLAVKAAILPAIAVAALASATELAAGWARVTGSAAGGQTALEAATSRGVAAETETHLEEVPGVLGDTTDPARVPTAAAVPRAWAPEVEAPGAEVDAAAVVGADSGL
jgi:hypothetical protein